MSPENAEIFHKLSEYNLGMEISLEYAIIDIAYSIVGNYEEKYESNYF